ncbi:MAG: TolC family outer membrane protein, partial [Ramlibacter sp.]
RVAEAYFSALLADEQLALVVSQKTAYTSQVDAARKGFAAGAGTRTDIDEAQARLDLTVAQELEARQNVDYSRRQLQTLIGQPVDTLAPVDVQRLVVAPTVEVLSDWTTRAEQYSPDMASARAQVEAAQQEINKVQAGHLPTLDAVAQMSRSTSENITTVHSRYDQKVIGLQLSVPIFQGGYVNSQVRQAVAELERARNVLEASRLDLGARVYREYRGVTEGVLRVKALEQAVKSNEQLVISSRRSYQAGSRTLLDILNSEQQLVAARRDLAQARFNYIASRVRLKALVGEVRPANVDEINGWLQH